MKSIILVILFFSYIFSSKAQTSRFQYGGYIGSGISKYDENSQGGFAFEVGNSLIIKKKDNRIRRKEIYLQYADNTYFGDSRLSNVYNEDDSIYALSDYHISFLHLGIKSQIPIIHKDKYRLLISPGIFFGTVLSYTYIRSWYYFSDNSVKNVSNNAGFVLSRIVWGPTIGIQNEIKLKTNMYLHVDFNLLSQNTFEYESSGPWFTFMLRTGLYWCFN
jgi:hypothetical protein